MMRRLRQEEGGWALVTALGLMAIALAFGMATLSQVEIQQEASGVSRAKETAFNAAEAALSAQIFQLAQDWPGEGRQNQAYPVCTPSSTSPRCPTSQALQSASASPDALRGVTWTTMVRDNGTDSTRSFYEDSLTQSAPGYDEDGDGRLWVRAQASVGGRKRTLVALVRVEEVTEPFPRAAVVAGRLTFSNEGNKILLDGREGSLPVASVRCTPALLELKPCLGHLLGTNKYGSLLDLKIKLDQQIFPNVTVTNHASPPTIDAAARERMKRTAIADGTYYETCPSSPPVGRLVWIASGTCTWTGNEVVNSEQAPGILILENATLWVAGTVDFHGVIYAINPTNTNDHVVTIHGNARVFGGVLIDGQGGLDVGSSKVNVTLRNSAYNAARSYVSAGIVQNTWREIVSST